MSKPTTPAEMGRKGGACEYGIRSWCVRAGLFDAYEAGGAKLMDLWTAYNAVPAMEARRTIIAALREAAS